MAIWAEELRPLDEEVALRVVARVRVTQDDPPTPARLREIVRSVSGEYDFGVQGARALPPAEMTPEERENALTVFRRLKAEMYARHPEWNPNAAGGIFAESAEDRLERTRAIARQPIPPEDTSIRDDLQRMTRGAKSVGGCSGAGKEVAVDENGRRVCPDCGAEVEDIIVEVPRSQAAGLVR